MSNKTNFIFTLFSIPKAYFGEVSLPIFILTFLLFSSFFLFCTKYRYIDIRYLFIYELLNISKAEKFFCLILFFVIYSNSLLQKKSMNKIAIIAIKILL